MNIFFMFLLGWILALDQLHFNTVEQRHLSKKKKKKKKIKKKKKKKKKILSQPRESTKNQYNKRRTFITSPHSTFYPIIIIILYIMNLWKLNLLIIFFLVRGREFNYHHTIYFTSINSLFYFIKYFFLEVNFIFY